ncbi:protein kinase [Geothrix sp. 21YS21S-2]|uniref:serine/threonine-protein kinase n=1 Tax=Geothrix sp. 21YS21S-2 TaxID=3068893 RepID=UPI0027B8C406|nr:protein kinase [Geothrix sp. 21YS21S-2]
MNLPQGTQLGPYEVLNPLGRGGQVYRARDARQGRLVVVRILPEHLAGDPRARVRFEQEAQAIAALGHPNLPGFQERDTRGDPPYGVMELLDGEALQARLEQGALAPRLAVELAIQLAQGLAAAHERGVIHRGLAPARLWLGRDGRLRILDFGLARRTPPDEAPALLEPDADLAYLSPEQARGGKVDARTDIFSFGAVFYEMLTGRKAFARASAAATLAAVLQEEPGEPERPIPPALRRILDHCLEKEPARRFRDAQDLAFALGNLSLGPSTLAAPLAPGNRRRTVLWAAAGLLLALGALGLGLGNRRPRAPVFHRLTFAAGTVETARFGADGRTVYFSMRVAGGPPEIFVLDPRSTEPKALGLSDALLLDVSPADELALIQEPRFAGGTRQRGTLIRVPGGGGAPRVVRENVAEARWDGAGLATVAPAGAQDRLEFPEGRVAETWDGATRTLGAIALSRDRNLLACLDSDASRATTEVAVHDRQGGRKVLFTKVRETDGSSLTGLAWGPGGDLWVSDREADQTVLWALSPGGGRRVLMRSQGNLQLLDVASDGRALLAQQTVRQGVLALRPGDDRARDLPLRARTRLRGIGPDGSPLLLDGDPGRGPDLGMGQGALPGLRSGEGVVGWSEDGGSAFVRSNPTRLPVTVTRLKPATAQRKVLASLSPQDPAGFLECREVFVAEGGRALALAYRKELSDLYRVEGLAP